MTKSTQANADAFQINIIYNSIYLRVFQQAMKEIMMERDKTINDLYDRWLNLIDKEVNRELRSDSFLSLLSRFINSSLDLRSALQRADYPAQYFHWLFDSYLRILMVFASVPKEFDLTPFDVEYVKGKTRLLHYHNIVNKNEKGQEKRKKKPVLITYAQINRFYIMDIRPDISVVRNLLSNGLDIYLLDWGYPSWEDRCISMNDYVDYVRNSVEYIKGKTEFEKISLIGYCWGGIIALIYTALNNNENINSLALMATPIDFSKDNTILANWAKAVDANKILDEFGHLDGQILDLAFLMRNPPRYAFDKYLKLIKKLDDKKFVDNFISVEKWLYDTPIIPGKFFRKIINDCYKNNLLISNRMKIEDNEGIGKEGRSVGISERENDDNQINLKNINVPLLTIVAEQDDLVSSEATLAINDYVSSKDKRSISIPGGHVGLCISKYAHGKTMARGCKMDSF
jgi:polyhydroxyalkanoate synthase